MIQGAARLLQKALTIRPLVFLGQHSLHVFSAHIVIVYLLAAIFQDGPPNELVGTLIILLCVFGLYLAAWLHAKSVEREKSIKAG
jgi:peptidoglycan/LPS O-acetylase OafA/YrhL